MKTVKLLVASIDVSLWLLRITLDDGTKYEANSSDAKLVADILSCEDDKIIVNAIVVAINYVLDQNNVDYLYANFTWNNQHGYTFYIEEV